MFPRDGKYVCNCGAEKEIGGESEVIVSNVKEKITAVIDGQAHMTKTRVKCPKCGYGEAYYEIKQTRAADEPETTIYTCCKCNYGWREY